MSMKLRSHTVGVQVLVAALIAAIPFSATAQAQTLTNNMSCSQAKSVFEQRGRLTTRSRGGQILPIYGGVPARLKSQLRCYGDSIKAPRMVVTRDKRNCAVSYQCY